MHSGPVLTLDAFDVQSAAQTDTSLIAAQTGKKIVVYQLYVTAESSVVVTFETGSTAVWKQFVGAGGGAVVPYTGIAWFETEAGEALTYTTDGAANVAISVKAAAV